MAAWFIHLYWRWYWWEAGESRNWLWGESGFPRNPPSLPFPSPSPSRCTWCCGGLAPNDSPLSSPLPLQCILKIDLKFDFFFQEENLSSPCPISWPAWPLSVTFVSSVGCKLIIQIYGVQMSSNFGSAFKRVISNFMLTLAPDIFGTFVPQI